MGVYMGIFNFFIVIPEIVASLSFQPLVKHVFGNDPLDVVLLGGASMLVAAGLTTRISETVTGDSEQAVPLTDAGGGLLVQEDAQPAPSSVLERQQLTPALTFLGVFKMSRSPHKSVLSLIALVLLPVGSADYPRRRPAATCPAFQPEPARTGCAMPWCMRSSPATSRPRETLRESPRGSAN